MTQSGEPVIAVADLFKCYGDVKAVDGVQLPGRARRSLRHARSQWWPARRPRLRSSRACANRTPGRRRYSGMDISKHAPSIKQRIGVQLQSVVAVSAA